MTKPYELKLCNNGTYYLYHKGILINNPYITFDKFHKEDAESIVGELNHLSRENEQLKQQLKDYHNAFDCSQCRYHNYDWFDDGDEFEVCDKGNTEALMYNHSCKDWEEL